MANMLFCIYCDSLDVTETWNEMEQSYNYSCYECYETWADDESEYEASL